jgi:hypothetical protein
MSEDEEILSAGLDEQRLSNVDGLDRHFDGRTVNIVRKAAKTTAKCLAGQRNEKPTGKLPAKQILQIKSIVNIARRRKAALTYLVIFCFKLFNDFSLVFTFLSKSRKVKIYNYRSGRLICNLD